MSVKTGFDPEHAAQHEGAYAAGELYEPDMGGNQPLIIFTYIAVLSTAFFFSLGGLYMYFKWEAEAEIDRKVRSLENPALQELRAEEDTRLQDIDNAMEAVAKQYQAAARNQGQNQAPNPPEQQAPQQGQAQEQGQAPAGGNEQ